MPPPWVTYSPLADGHFAHDPNGNSGLILGQPAEPRTVVAFRFAKN